MAESLTLVLGGAASGKSRLAEKLAEHSGSRLTYVATGIPGDAEMREKIRFHRERRGRQWSAIEEPAAVADVLRREGGADAILIDCLTLWVLNLMTAGAEIADSVEDLVEAAGSFSGPVIMVSGETGMGIIPDDALSRKFSNALGLVNQTLGSHADLVLLAVAGLPVLLKGEKPEWL